jgi:ABC-type polysaccharide/polyol phosphate export permease
MAEIVTEYPRRHRFSSKGLFWAIFTAFVLAVLATAVKALTGHSIAGLLVLVMFLAGILSLSWDWASKPRNSSSTLNQGR